MKRETRFVARANQQEDYYKGDKMNNKLVGHTPGSWYTEAGNVKGSLHYAVLTKIPVKTIADCSVSSILDAESCKANATLIAAAPELLEQAKTLQYLLTEYAHVLKADGFMDFEQAWESNKQAIAKAQKGSK